MKISLGVAMLLAITATGCASQKLRAWNGQEQTGRLDRTVGGDSRLVVQISHVNDAENGRNETNLFVNGKKIKARGTVGQSQRDHVYELSLPSGTHRIHAVYRAKSFWKELEFKLTTHDGRVRLYPDYTTFLTIALEKKSDGDLLRNKNLFTETPRAMKKTTTPQFTRAAAIPKTAGEAGAPLPTPSEEINTTTEPRPIIVQTVDPPQRSATPASAPLEAAGVQVLPLSRNDVPHVSLDRDATEEDRKASKTATMVRFPNAAAATATRTGTAALQINTTPTNAEVIVDDRYLGQSPLVTHVAAGRSHVIQISKQGYLEKIKMLDRNEFVAQQTYFLIEKLEKED